MSDSDPQTTPKGRIVLSCSHELVPERDEDFGVPVIHHEWTCDAVDGFKRVACYAQFCKHCAEELAMEGRYQVLLRRNSDGEVRTVHYEYEIQPYDYLWTEGNYGCDCNRHLFFERAGGHDPHKDEGYEGVCGDERYTAVMAIAPDGTEIPLDDDLQTTEPRPSISGLIEALKRALADHGDLPVVYSVEADCVRGEVHVFVVEEQGEKMLLLADWATYDT